jgi:hypothetical protein
MRNFVDAVADLLDLSQQQPSPSPLVIHRAMISWIQVNDGHVYEC